MKFSLKKLSVVALCACTVVGLSSCKSKESMYKKAYEKAQTQVKTEQPAVVAQPQTPVKVAPVAPVTTVDTSNEPTRSEQLTLISGTGLKAYSVVVGAFGLKTNAEGVQRTLNQKGYSAQIALNTARKLYRVIASTFDSKADAVASRNKLRATYPDAWILYNN